MPEENVTPEDTGIPVEDAGGLDAGAPPPEAEAGAEAGAEEGAPPAEEAAGSMIEVDASEFPEAAALSIGDPITMTVQEISEDGQKIKLGVSAEELPPIEGPGGGGPGGLPGGEAAIAQQLLGGGGGR